MTNKNNVIQHFNKYFFQIKTVTKRPSGLLYNIYDTVGYEPIVNNKYIRGSAAYIVPYGFKFWSSNFQKEIMDSEDKLFIKTMEKIEDINNQPVEYGINCSKCNQYYPDAENIDNFKCWSCRNGW